MKKKKTDITFWIKFQLLSLALVFLVSCSDVDVNFQVNGQDALSGTVTDEKLTNPDSTNMLRVFVGDTVIFRNTTQPVDEVNSQKWDVDGDELVDEEFNGLSGFKTVYSKPGRFMAALWVNDAAVPVKKWIEVQGDFEVFEDVLPSIGFVNPRGRIEESESRKFNLEASLTEIYNSDSIVLKVNGNPTDFEYDEVTGVLQKELSLTKGDNEIALFAYTEDGGVYSEMAQISYNPSVASISPQKKTASTPVKKKKDEPQSESELDDIFTSTSTGESEPKAEEKPKPKSAEAKKNLTEFAKAGYRSDDIDDSCRNDLVENYSFNVTPSKMVRIDDFVLFNTVCGKLEIVISSPEGELISTTETLTEGKSQISFGLFTEVLLQKDVQYVFTLKPVKGNSNCGSTESPKLVDTKACTPKLRKKSHLTTNFKGKSIIHDITYSY